MAEMRHFVVIGLGTFGAALATRLAKNGCRVTGIDSEEERVDELKDVLYEAVIGDATDRDALEHMPLQQADAVFVSMGEDITRSLLATLHAKELGARRIIVKGVTSEHGKILSRLGVERVVYPEIEIASQVADQFTWPNVIDFLPIDPEFSFLEIAVPDSLIGQSLQEINLRRRIGVWVVGVKDVMSGKLEMFPDGEFRLGADQMLLVVGRHSDLNRLRDLK
ncbi:MAG: TrkA family potassium uptake protein [Planctomycetes bacterium]|nr:TrkA family potassium uptake protein [Planctomycetota bacterium]